MQQTKRLLHLLWAGFKETGVKEEPRPAALGVEREEKEKEKVRAAAAAMGEVRRGGGGGGGPPSKAYIFTRTVERLFILVEHHFFILF